MTVVAPDTERSAVGHAITLSDPLKNQKKSKQKIKDALYNSLRCNRLQNNSMEYIKYNCFVIHSAIRLDKASCEFFR